MLPSFIFIQVPNLVTITLILKVHLYQVSKQLFGIVTGVRCLEQEQAIVTTHAGHTTHLGGGHPNF